MPGGVSSSAFSGNWAWKAVRNQRKRDAAIMMAAPQRTCYLGGEPVFTAAYSRKRLGALAAVVLGVFMTICVSAGFAAEKEFSARGLGGGGGLFVPSISPASPQLLLVSCDMGGVYRSENGGQSWSMLHTRQGLVQTHTAPPPVYLSSRIYWVTEKNRVCFSTDQGRTWTTMPPGPWKNSRILFLAVREGEADTLLVSTEAGLWQGDNAKRPSWRCLAEERGGPVLALGGMLYGVFPGGFIRSSADSGATWNAAGALHGEVVALAGSVSGTGATGQTVLLASVKEKGLVLSRDNGATWSSVKTPYENETALNIPPGQTERLYALQTGSVKTAHLLCSRDGGRSWNNIFRMPPPGRQRGWGNTVAPSWVQTELSWGYYFTSQGLAVSASNPDFALVTTQGEIYATRDGGLNWASLMNRALPPLEETSLRFASTGLEVTSAWGYHFDPHDEQREYITYTDIGFARSQDQGESWSWAAKGSRWKNTFYDLAFDPARPGRLYAAASQRHDIPHYLELSRTVGGYRVHTGGVVVSDDYGATWKTPYTPDSPTGLPNQVCTTVVLDPDSPPEKRTLYAGVFGEGDDDKAGVYTSTDGGTTWARLPESPGIPPNLHIYRLRLHPVTKELYCLITGLRGATRETFFKVPGGLWRSADKGATWTHISAGSQLNRWATAFAFDPADPHTIYLTAATPQGGTGAGGVYKTINSGTTWFHILKDDRMKVIAGAPDYDHSMAIAVHPRNPRIILAGTTLHGLLYSMDGGRFWRRYEAFPFHNAQSITFHPKDPDRIYVTTFGAGVWVGSLPRE